jgi:hypothetical protein
MRRYHERRPEEEIAWITENNIWWSGASGE